MDIQKHILNKIGVLLPISGGNGQSQEQAVIISSKYKHRYIEVQNDFILLWVDEGWRKVGQSLIVDDDGRKFDKVTIQNFWDDGVVVERFFLFDVTKCF